MILIKNKQFDRDVRNHQDINKHETPEDTTIKIIINTYNHEIKRGFHSQKSTN